MTGAGSESALLCFVVNGGVAGSFLGIGEGLAGGGGGGTLGAEEKIICMHCFNISLNRFLPFHL